MARTGGALLRSAFVDQLTPGASIQASPCKGFVGSIFQKARANHTANTSLFFWLVLWPDSSTLLSMMAEFVKKEKSVYVARARDRFRTD